MERAFRAMLTGGLAPHAVAAAVLPAVRDERFYVITHAEMRATVRRRMENIVAGRIPTLQPIV